MQTNNSEHVEVMPSTLETIDMAFFNWVDKELDLQCTSNKGYNKCPVIWTAPESSFQIKEFPTLRDNTGAIILPMITIERTGVKKGHEYRGGVYGQINEMKGYDPRGGALEICRRIKQDKTANFANAEYQNGRLFPTKQKNEKIVWETFYIPMPVYISVTHEITIQTNYQTQMNELSEPFMTVGGSQNRKILRQDGHMYEVFIDGDFSSENNVKDTGDEERLFKTVITCNTLGYLLESKDGPLVTRRESTVEYKFPKESSTLTGE